MRAKDRRRFLRLLNWRPGGSVYSRVVGAALDRIDRWLTPEDVTTRPTPYPDKPWYRNIDWLLAPRAAYSETARRVGAFPWGWTLLDTALLFAFLYPIGLLVILWAVVGGEGRIGALVVLSDDVSAWIRWAVAASFAAMMLGRLSGRVGFIWLGFFSLLAVFWLTEDLRSGAAFVFAGAGAVVIAGAGAFAVVVAGAAAFAFGGAVAGAVAFAGAFAVAVAVAWAVRRGRAWLGYLALVAGALGLLVLAAAIPIPEQRVGAVAAWLLFLGVLPLLNGVFDWLSIGVTRWCLRRGVRSGRSALIWGGADLGVALLLFTGLGFSLILTVHAMNSVAAVPLLDLQGLFDDLRREETRGDYIWLYAMIFSTVVPTGLHLALSAFSLIAMIPGSWRRTVRGWIVRARDYDTERWAAAGALAAMAAVSLVGPPFLIVLGIALIPEAAGYAGETYLGVFERFARTIGAAVEVGEPLGPRLPPALDV